MSETVRLASAGRTGIEGRGSEGFLSETLGATNRSTVLLLFILGGGVRWHVIVRVSCVSSA